MKLSKRLQMVADAINKYKQGNILADIGCDHGYLPCYLVENKIITTAYACDINEGPLDKSKETIKQYNLEDQVFPLLGPGLDPIVNKDVDMIAMAGMGAYLISEIMEDNKDYLEKVNVLFLQANSNNDHLRQYLFKNNWIIVDEDMVKDTGHIYEVMVVTKRKDCVTTYSEKDETFGPILSKQCSPLFKEKWEKQHFTYKNIIETLDEDHPRFKELTHKIKMIEEVLHDSK